MKARRHPTEKLGRKPKATVSSLFPRLKLLFQDTVTFIAGLGKNTKLAVALIAVLIAAAGLVGLLGSGESETDTFTAQIPEETTNVNALKATLEITEGTVEFKNQEGDWKSAAKDDELVEGDDIRTVGATSRASLRFENGSIIRIDANSEIMLQTVTTDRIVIKQTDGYSFSRVSTSESSSYIVRSVDAHYEAAGTAFQVITNGDEQAVEVYENSVVETSTNQNVTQGNKLTVSSNVQPSDNGRISKIDIEISKKNTFIMWNRSLDMEKDEFKDKLGFLSDIDAPDITITSPEDNKTILVEPNAIKGTVEFNGITAPNTTISILSKSSATAEAVTVTADSSGNFTSPIIEAALGSSVFEFTAQDKAGNTTIKNIRLTFQRKSAPIVTTTGLELSLEETDTKIKLRWNYLGSTKPTDGVKLVYSSSKTPTYPDDSPIFIEKDTEYTIMKADLTEDKTYEFRVCIYDEDSNTCSPYSNSIKVTL
jgi:hypothetical protein